MITALTSKSGRELVLRKIVTDCGIYCQSYCYEVKDCKELVAEIHQAYLSLAGEVRYYVIPHRINPIHGLFITIQSALDHVAGVY